MMSWIKNLLVIALLVMCGVAKANVHLWEQTEFRTYSDKTHVQFKLINRYDAPAKYFLRIDEKHFPNALVLHPNEEKVLDITVNTPPGINSEKKVCTRMDTGAPEQYEVCTRLTFKRY